MNGPPVSPLPLFRYSVCPGWWMSSHDATATCICPLCLPISFTYFFSLSLLSPSWAPYTWSAVSKICNGRALWELLMRKNVPTEQHPMNGSTRGLTWNGSSPPKNDSKLQMNIGWYETSSGWTLKHNCKVFVFLDKGSCQFKRNHKPFVLNIFWHANIGKLNKKLTFLMLECALCLSALALR